MCAVATWLVELYDVSMVVFVLTQLSVVYTKLTFEIPTFPAVTVVVTVTWSFGPGEAGEMPGVLMLGPGGGAATRPMSGARKRSETTIAIFLVNDAICFPYVLVGKAKQTLLVTGIRDWEKF